MKDRASAKDEVEKKRLFYVGATRARDRLILSGSLNEYGNPENMLKWLFKYLGIGEDADSISLPVTVEVYLNENTTSQSFQLQNPKLSDNSMTLMIQIKYLVIQLQLIFRNFLSLSQSYLISGDPFLS